jgi:hypothetical protein
MAKPVQKKTAPKTPLTAKTASTIVPEAAPKKRHGIMVGIALLGVICGGAAAGGYFIFLGPKAEARAAQAAIQAKAAEALLPPEIMEIDRMVLPMISADGELLGYVTLEMVLELERGSSEFVKVRVPMIRHGFNEAMATQSVVNSSDRGLNFAAASKILTKAANTALGYNKVLKVNIVTALPI